MTTTVIQPAVGTYDLPQQYHYRHDQFANEVAIPYSTYYSAGYLHPAHFQHQVGPTIHRQNSPIRSVHLAREHISAGSIVFLPRPKDHSAFACVKPGCNNHIDQGAFNHPAVVLKIFEEDTEYEDTMTLCCIVSYPHLCVLEWGGRRRVVEGDGDWRLEIGENAYHLKEVTMPTLQLDFSKPT